MNNVSHRPVEGAGPLTHRPPLWFPGVMTPLLVMRRHVDYGRVTNMACPAVR
ncbi:hypothetical protein ACIOC1_12370 [Streptomyces sp. NPDC088197]|uniref:hypothetical protein n=1 Tax=unclassified Streptomyces TaxID=2593676 RepID=UPI0033BCD788